jgi:Skp family chaperone for outer membrane proteins
MLRVLFAALWMPLLGIAQTPAQAPATQASAVIAPVKIAWINLEQAIFTCDEGKGLLGEIQKYIETKNSELDALRKEADGLHNQLNVQGPKLTDEARTDLEDQIEVKDTALQRFQQDTQKDINGRRDRVTNYIGKRMLPVIEKVSKEKGLNAVLYYNSARDAWVDPALNITEEIVKSYNQTYPVGTPKAPAAPAPAKKP